MFNDNMFKSMMDLFGNPIVRKGFLDFYLKMQQEGMEEAKKSWNLSGEKYPSVPNAQEFFEKMADFNMLLGFVPSVKYDEVLKENEKLKKENSFLKDTIRELQGNLFKEGTEKAQEAWQTIIDKQLEMNKEIAKNFIDQFKELKKKDK
ncbi:MAG: hypothetical protein Q7T53_12245 [Deltaproteobacteria bacterium]|nr:hypothetical protein [Deltaproteobacteria bacterium]